MTTHEFGTGPNPGSFAESEDPSNPGQALRVAEGAIVKVKNALTDEALADTTALNLGYLAFTLEDVPAVYVSADDGDNWFGPLWSKQAQAASMVAGINASDALTEAQAARLTADEALARVGTGTGGGSGPEYIVQPPGSPGVYPTPVTSGPRWFFGELEPTEDQGYRDLVPFGDAYWPLRYS